MDATIALFVYNRPEHTRRLLASLARNPEARDALLYVFSDGPRSEADRPSVEEVRAVLRTAPCRVIQRDRPANLGLAESITSGVDEVLSRHDRLIVLEDDLELSPAFLSFMRQALTRYENAPGVMQISGYMFPLGLEPARPAAFLPMISSWGWATWARAWRHFDPDLTGFAQLKANAALRRRFDLDGAYPFFDLLERQARGSADSWAIRWYLSVFLQGGLTLFPPVSLVRNGGWDGSGTHRFSGSQFDTPLARAAHCPLPGEAVVSEDVYARLQRYFRRIVPSLGVPRAVRWWTRLGRLLLGRKG